MPCRQQATVESIKKNNRLQLKRERLASSLAYVSSSGHVGVQRTGTGAIVARRSDVDVDPTPTPTGRWPKRIYAGSSRPPCAKLAVSIAVALCKSESVGWKVSYSFLHGAEWMAESYMQVLKLGQRSRDGHYTTSQSQHMNFTIFLPTCRVGRRTLELKTVS